MVNILNVKEVQFKKVDIKIGLIFGFVYLRSFLSIFNVLNLIGLEWLYIFDLKIGNNKLL